MLSVFFPAPGTVPPSLRQAMVRAVATPAANGRVTERTPTAVANSFNRAGEGTQLELSQIDRYDPATLAPTLPPHTAVLLTCSNADQYFTCGMEDRIALGVAKANAKIDFVHLDGVEHILKEDVALDTTAWNQALPFSSRLRSALSKFVANNL